MRVVIRLPRGRVAVCGVRINWVAVHVTCFTRQMLSSGMEENRMGTCRLSVRLCDHVSHAVSPLRTGPLFP